MLPSPVLRGTFGVEGGETSAPSPLDTPRLVTGGIRIFRPPIYPDLEFGPPVFAWGCPLSPDENPRNPRFS